MAGVYFGAERADRNLFPVTAIYNTTDKSTTIKLADGTDYDIGEAREISVSTDGMYIWFSRNTASATGKYDLRMIEVGSKKSLKKQGKFIEKGIDENDQGRSFCLLCNHKIKYNKLLYVQHRDAKGRDGCRVG